MALGQRRLHLDRALFEAARATAGVEAIEGVAVDGAVVEDGRAVGLRVGGEVRRARLVIGADGPHSPVRRSLGLDAPRPKRARIGLRTHFRLARPADQPSLIEVFIGDGHELYVTPLPGDEVLVAGLSDRAVAAEDPAGGARAALARWIDEEPVLRARLAGAEPLTAVAGRSPLGHRARAGFAPGAVLLGDAAGFIDPVTAGGMAQALLTAELLAPFVTKALADGGARGDRWLRRFDRQRRALLRDYHLLTRFVLFLVGRPTLARAMMRLMRSSRDDGALIGWRAGTRLIWALLRVRPVPSPLRSAAGERVRVRGSGDAKQADLLTPTLSSAADRRGEGDCLVDVS